MTVWFMDGFDYYTDDTYGAGGAGTADTIVDLMKKWTGYTGGTGIFLAALSPFIARQQPGQGISPYSSSQPYMLYKNRPAGSAATLFGGVAFMLTGAISTAVQLLAFLDGTTEQCSVRLDSSYHITFQRGTTVLATSTNTISANTWYYLEAKATISSTVGQYEVRINGSSTGWIPQSTANKDTASTANDYGTAMGISGSSILVYRYDDLYFADTVSPNSDFLGPQIVFTLRPAGAGTYSQWTPNWGTNYGNVNEIYPDGDITFNQSSTADQVDSFPIQKLPVASGIVYAVQETVLAKQDSGAQRSIATFLRVNDDDNDGDTVNLSTSYTMVLKVWNTNPQDGAAWEIADVNETEIGYKLIS